MTHEFDAAKVIRDDTGSWFCLHIKNAPMARNECGQMKHGKTYVAEIKRKYNKRSGRANAYAWELMGKLAAAIGLPRQEIYRSFIPDVGDNFRTVAYTDDCQKTLITGLWESQGLGWVVEDAGNGWLICYYGSSTYDTTQMGRLIDLIVQDCKEQGIETASASDILCWVEQHNPEAREV